MSTEQMDSDFLALWKVEEESLKARHYSPVSIGHECCKAYAWWQQSRAALVISIDKHTEFEIEHIASPCEEKDTYAIGWIDGRNYAAKQVRAAGITVKEG